VVKEIAVWCELELALKEHNIHENGDIPTAPRIMNLLLISCLIRDLPRVRPQQSKSARLPALKKKDAGGRCKLLLPVAKSKSRRLCKRS
jgi:hypothetical protein